MLLFAWDKNTSLLTMRFQLMEHGYWLFIYKDQYWQFWLHHGMSQYLRTALCLHNSTYTIACATLSTLRFVQDYVRTLNHLRKKCWFPSKNLIFELIWSESAILSPPWPDIQKNDVKIDRIYEQKLKFRPRINCFTSQTYFNSVRSCDFRLYESIKFSKKCGKTALFNINFRAVRLKPFTIAYKFSTK